MIAMRNAVKVVIVMIVMMMSVSIVCCEPDPWETLAAQQKAKQQTIAKQQAQQAQHQGTPASPTAAASASASANGGAVHPEAPNDIAFFQVRITHHSLNTEE